MPHPSEWFQPVPGVTKEVSQPTSRGTRGIFGVPLGSKGALQSLRCLFGRRTQPLFLDCPSLLLETWYS